MKKNTTYRSVMIFIAGEESAETKNFVNLVSLTLPDFGFLTAYENENPYIVENLITKNTVCFFVDTRRNDIGPIIAMAKNFFENDSSTKKLFSRIIFFGEEKSENLNLLGLPKMYLINNLNCYYVSGASAQKNSRASRFQFVADKIPLS